MASLSLSAHLYEISGDTRYSSAAELAAEFIRAFLYSKNIGVIADTFVLAQCAIFSDIAPTTYGSGYTIWGLSVLASKNSTWTPLCVFLLHTSSHPQLISFCAKSGKPHLDKCSLAVDKPSRWSSYCRCVEVKSPASLHSFISAT